MIGKGGGWLDSASLPCHATAHGFWWDRGLLAKDVLAYISADLPDSEETREWVKSYASTKLIARFQQDAIYLRWLSVETELVRPVERVTRTEEE